MTVSCPAFSARPFLGNSTAKERSLGSPGLDFQLASTLVREDLSVRNETFRASNFPPPLVASFQTYFNVVSPYPYTTRVSRYFLLPICMSKGRLEGRNPPCFVLVQYGLEFPSTTSISDINWSNFVFQGSTNITRQGLALFKFRATARTKQSTTTVPLNIILIITASTKDEHILPHKSSESTARGWPSPELTPQGPFPRRPMII